MSEENELNTIRIDAREYQALVDDQEANRAILDMQRKIFIEERNAMAVKFNALEERLRKFQHNMDKATEIADFCVQLIEAVQGSHSYTHHQKEMIFSLLIAEMRKISQDDLSDIPF